METPNQSRISLGHIHWINMIEFPDYSNDMQMLNEPISLARFSVTVAIKNEGFLDPCSENTEPLEDDGVRVSFARSPIARATEGAVVSYRGAFAALSSQNSAVVVGILRPPGQKGNARTEHFRVMVTSTTL